MWIKIIILHSYIGKKLHTQNGTKNYIDPAQILQKIKSEGHEITDSWDVEETKN